MTKLNLIVRFGLILLGVIFLFTGFCLNEGIFIFYSLLIQLFHNILYGLEHFHKRSIFLIFNVTFFIFLIGRLFVTYFFNYKNEAEILGLNFNDQQIIQMVFIIIYISLLSLFIGFSINNKSLNQYFNVQNITIQNVDSIRLASLVIFLISFVMRILYWIDAIKSSNSVGYYEYFSNFESSLPGGAVAISRMMPVSFFMYLSTLPKRKSLYFPVFLYLIEGMVAMLTGSRSGFMLNLLIILIYMIMRSYRNKKVCGKYWFGKTSIFLSIILVPFLLILLNLVEIKRNKNINVTEGFWNSLLEFFYAQGVSVNVIGYTISLSEQIPNKTYSIGPIIEFIKYNILGTLFGSQGAWKGQSIERAMEGYQYTHTISYLIMPDLYLKGVGYGSSYVAELFHDLGFIGLIIGGILTGYLIQVFSKMMGSKNFYLIFLSLIITRSLFFIPRASWVAYVVDTFTPINIISFIVIIIFSAILSKFMDNAKIGRRN